MWIVDSEKNYVDLLTFAGIPKRRNRPEYTEMHPYSDHDHYDQHNL